MSLDTLKKAIEQKAPVSFEYNKQGKVKGERVGNPHAIFIMRRKDQSESTKVHIYQIDGVSDSGQVLPSFRMFDLEEITNVKIIEDSTFEISDKYNPEWDGYKFTIARV